MSSPFPGMDPYIESPDIWGDFHAALATEIRTQLNRQIQPRYVARLIPYTAYEVVEIGETRAIRPDIGIWMPHPPAGAVGEIATAVTPAPVRASITQEIPIELLSVEIRKTGSMELITAIEILSPVNKRVSHDAYTDYLRKRREILRSSAHLLEIDLLRGGERPPLQGAIPVAPYYVSLSRVEDRPSVEVWPIQLWDELPVLPAPLREPDQDAQIDLATMVATLYEQGGYATLIDYHRQPPPPVLTKEQNQWLDDYLHQQGIR
ncbi:MAG: DUF4058 family protein [Caldilineaceae bacterium]